MSALLIASLRAVRSFFAPGMFAIFVWSVLATIATLIGFIIGASAFFSWLAGHLHSEGAQFLPWIGSFGAGILAWFLFPGIMPIIVNFFDERIARVIERQDYPTAILIAKPPLRSEFLHDLRFSLTVVLLNLLALPLYIFFSVLSPLVFYLLNGYLLGREFFIINARRYLPMEEAEALRRRYSRIITLGGAMLAVLATIPIINLFAPFWGIAMMLHLYHRLSIRT